MKWTTLILLVVLAACAHNTDRSPDSVTREEPKALDYHRYYPSDFR